MIPKPQDACALPRKKNMGRPRKSEPRTKQLNVSLTTAEYESFVKRAAALGMRPVHFGRKLLVASNCPQQVNPRGRSNIEKLNYSALVRMGNNLNQMMRHLHQTGEPVPADLEPLLRDIRAIVARGGEK
jgi:hypothetical protein